MAGMHFIILKVNGVDVTQMPHDEAAQMFLKASEPILVEVRRRSYNDDNPERVVETQLSDTPIHKEHISSRRQSPTVSQLSSPAKHQRVLAESQTNEVVDSLKFDGLKISSSQSSFGLSKNVSNTGLPCPTNSTKTNTINISASTSSYYSYKDQISYADDVSKRSTYSSGQQKSSPISSASVSKPLHLQSAASSPFKEQRTTSQDEDTTKLSNKELVSIGVQTEPFTTNFIFNDENDHNLFSECLAPEIDIEEVTLRKSDSNERLGLTVCYSSGGGNGSGSDDTDTCTEVYISDIVPDSIAGRDGRLRQGDQILQVNGKDVSNKEETENLIAENNNAVTLLVSRYLYGDDDDDFNEQGDFYEDDETNIGYENCFLENYILNEDFSKSAKNSNNTSPEKKPLSEEIVVPKVETGAKNTITIDTSTGKASSSTKDPLNHQNIRAHLEQVNQEIAMLDSRVENMMSQHTKPLKGVEPTEVTKKPKDPARNNSSLQIMDYDIEHIYETIPEDSESEPFYCSPYVSSDHPNRIEQWLGLQEGASDQTKAQKQHIIQQNNDNLVICIKAKNETIRSTNSSAGDDHENSSSAYNTGGSCNSNSLTPLTLELNTNNRDRDHHSISALVLCPTKHAVSPLVDVANQHRPPSLQPVIASADSTDNGRASHRYAKDKNFSPSHSSKVASQLASYRPKVFATAPQRGTDYKNNETTKSTHQSTPMSASNTMYTNVANLQQTMLLQQQLFRQALVHQRVPSTSVPCPQFTAPNLSQYHFVSSQEVSTVKLNTHPHEEHMVWKVKRRQDGTRYIVRRPARSRFLRNRALRISAERDDQTTEDDTLSEIKTGRYWTKEERKKHFERARERRQRQQIIIANKNNESTLSTTLNTTKNPDILPKIYSDKHVLQMNHEIVQQINQPKVIQTTNTIATTSSAKVHRQSTPIVQSYSKKYVKKIANSPVQVSSSGNTAANVVAPTVSKPAPASGGGKMVGLLSVTTV